MDPLTRFETNTDPMDSDPLKIIKHEIENTIKPEPIDAEGEKNKMKVFQSRSHKCKKCKSKYKYNCLLSLHLQKVHAKVEAPSVKCDFCQAVKNSEANMRLHILKYHDNQDRKYTCDMCNK